MENNLANKIKNLKVNYSTIAKWTCYGGCVLLPLGIFKAFNNDPFVLDNEKAYLNTITTIDNDGSISYQETYLTYNSLRDDKNVITITDQWMQDEENGYYFQTTKEYVVDDTFYNLLHYAKEDPDSLEELLDDPSSVTTVKKNNISDIELSNPKEVRVDIYEKDMDQYISVQQSDGGNITDVVAYLSCVALAFGMTYVGLEVVGKKLVKKKENKEA